MFLEAHIENGQIVVDMPVDLPDGTRLRIEVIEGPPPAFADRFRQFIGAAENLPADASVNLDHYLYGVPKKEA